MKVTDIDFSVDGKKYIDEDGYVWVVDFNELIPEKEIEYENVLGTIKNVNYITEFYNLFHILNMDFTEVANE